MRLSGGRRIGRPPLWLAALAAGVALVAVAPVYYLAERARAQGLSAVAEEVLQRRTLDLVVRSTALTAVVTVACTVIGVGAAFVVTRTNLAGRSLWRVLLALPLAIPTYVAAYTWVAARPSLAGFWGAALVLVLCSYPYVFLPVTAALAGLDPAQEEAARSLGLAPREVFRRVTLRQVRPAASAGALLVALYVLSDFGAVATMRYEAFTWVIYAAYNAGFNPARAAILSTVLLAVALVLSLGELSLRGRAAQARIGAGVARPAAPLRLGAAAAPAAAALAAVVGAAVGFPLVSIARWLAAGGLDVAWAAVAGALWASLRVSLLAALVTTAAALPVGALAARSSGRFAALVERASYVPHALPGIVIAVSMVYAGVRLLRPLYQETPLLVLAYLVLFLPLAVGAVRNALEQGSLRLEEVARSLGRSQLRAFAEITARLAAPGVAAGAALVFLASMKELPVTLLLHPTGMVTLATGLWQRTGVSDYPGAAPYAAALVLFSGAPTALLGWWSGRLARAPDQP